MDISQRIQQAIEEQLAEEGGGFVTSWFLVADSLDREGEPSWIYAAPRDQRQITTMGLLKWSMGIAEYEQNEYLRTLE